MEPKQYTFLSYFSAIADEEKPMIQIQFLWFAKTCAGAAVGRIVSKKLTNLVAAEEERYNIITDQRKQFPIYVKMINFFTNNLIERKRYLYEEKGEIKEIKKDNFE